MEWGEKSNRYNTYKAIIFIKTLYTRTCMTFLKIKMKKKYYFHTLKQTILV